MSRYNYKQINRWKCY